MAKGVIYVMESSFPGMVAFGSVEVGNYAAEINKMRSSSFDGIGDFREKCSMLVEGYEQKANLVMHIFAHRRIHNTNLFVVDGEVMAQLLSSFTGEQIFPGEPTEVEILRNSVVEGAPRDNWGKVPTGMYYLSENRRFLGHCEARMHVKDGLFIVKAGSECFPVIGLTPKVRDRAIIDEGILQEDVVCHSPSAAATVVMGRNANGWMVWKTINDLPINVYRLE